MRTQIDVGDVIGRSFSVWTANVVQFAAIAILFSIPFIVIQASPALLDAPQGAAYLGQFGNFLAGQIVTGMIAFAVFQTLSGTSSDIGRSMSVAFSKFGALVVASILATIVTFIGMLLCVVPGIIAAIVFSVVVPAVVVEKLGPIAGLSRSIELTEGNRLQIFLVYLVIGVLYMIVFGGISCFSGFAVAGSAGASGFGDGFQAGQQVAQSPMVGLIQVGGGILGAIIMTFQATLSSVIYTDLREIKEGTNVDQLIDVFQ